MIAWWHWLCGRHLVFMVPISDTEYVPGDTVYKLVPPFYVGNAPSRWEWR